MSDQADRQLGEKATEQGGRKHGYGKLRLRRRPSQPRGPRRSEPRPESRPIEGQPPASQPDEGGRGKGILDDLDRSDRESGRPVQLGEGAKGETASGHQPEAGGEVGEATRP